MAVVHIAYRGLPTSEAVVDGVGNGAAGWHEFALLLEPHMQRIQNRYGALLSQPSPIVSLEPPGLALNAVQRLDAVQGVPSYRAFVAGKDLDELAPGVRHAAQYGDSLVKAGLVAGVVIVDQLALPVAQEGAAVLARAALGQIVDHGLEIIVPGAGIYP